MISFEDKGIPTANVTTTEFMTAARAQCAALGMPEYEPILVEHPIQPKTRDEVRALADQVMDQVISTLLARREQGTAEKHRR